MTSRHRHPSTLALSAVLGVALLAGCGGDKEPTDDPTSATSPSPSDSPSGEPTGETSPAVEPASGTTIRGDQFSVNIPKGWQADPEQIGVTYTYDPDSTATIVTGVTEVGQKSLDEAAALFLSSTSREGVRRVADATLGGEAAFHLAAETTSEYTFEAYGLWRNNQLVTLEFDLTGTEAERADLIASVLATWRWT